MLYKKLKKILRIRMKIYRRGRIIVLNFFFILSFRYIESIENYILKRVMGIFVIIDILLVNFGK